MTGNNLPAEWDRLIPPLSQPEVDPIADWDAFVGAEKGSLPGSRLFNPRQEKHSIAFDLRVQRGANPQQNPQQVERDADGRITKISGVRPDGVTWALDFPPGVIVTGGGDS